jgi:hypothetical protein
MELCPHCGGQTTSEPSRDLRWVCGACGGARVPGVTLGAASVALLARAKSDRTRQTGASFVAAGLVAMALFLAAIALLAAVTGHGVPAFGAAGLAAADFAVAMGAWRFARKSAAASRDALDGAWANAAALVARKHGGEITARDLARTLKTSELDADAILAKLSAGGASVEVDDDAQLHYRVDAGADGSAAAPESETMTEPPKSANREASR